MPVTELNEDTQDQICDLLENLQLIEKLKNKDIRILLDKIVRKYGGKVINKWNSYYPTISFSYFTQYCKWLPFVYSERTYSQFKKYNGIYSAGKIP